MSAKPWGTLPVSRILTIMKSSSEAECIGKESSLMMTKAAELFIKNLAKEGYDLTDNGKKLDYKHLAEVVNRDERYEFLRDIMPKKITVLEYKKMLAKQQDNNHQNTLSDDEDDESGTEGSKSNSESE